VCAPRRSVPNSREPTRRCPLRFMGDSHRLLPVSRQMKSPPAKLRAGRAEMAGREKYHDEYLGTGDSHDTIEAGSLLPWPLGLLYPAECARSRLPRGRAQLCDPTDAETVDFARTKAHEKPSPPRPPLPIGQQALPRNRGLPELGSAAAQCR